MNKRIVTINEVQTHAMAVAARIGANHNYRFLADIKLYGIPRGGIPAALAVQSYLSNARLVDDPREADIFIDDIYDSGKTCQAYAVRRPGIPFEVLFDKRDPQWWDQWLVMPWERTEERDDSGTDIVTRLLEYIGEDPNRGGLRETPARVLNAWREDWAWGYSQDPAAVLKTFTDGAHGFDEFVIVHNIPVVSKCEHHLADITGHAHVGYIPNGKIVGLSKLARLVEIYSRRLQVQERLTVQIADCLVENLQPIGVGVLIRAAHACMSTRGVRISGSTTTTSAMRGALMTKPEARKEFMDLCAMAERDRIP